MKISKRQIAGMNICYGFFSFDYFLNSMQRLGLHSIEVHGAAPHLLLADLTAGEIQSIGKNIIAHNLEVICFTPEQCKYPVNIAYKDDYARERSLRYLESSIRICTSLGCSRMLVTPGYGYFDEPREEAWKRSAESLFRLTAAAEKEGVTLVLEPLRQDETNLVTSLTSLKEMLDTIHSPALKGMLDTSPMYFAGEHIRDYFTCLGKDLNHIHFIDGMPEGHLVWGDGIFPLDEYVKDVVDGEYRGYLTIELTSPRYYHNPHGAMERTMQALAPYVYV